MALDKSAPILVVDDQQNMLDLTGRFLTRLGFNDVVYCTSGQEALSKLRQRAFDLIISDLHMDPVTGLDLLRAVRDGSALGAPKFLITTGSVSAAFAKSADADACLIKPFTRAQLKETLDQLFG